jgi:colanic acid biosynthesis glycosyl transferase WcaI
MRILLVTPHYLPDGGPSAPLFTMLCEALVGRGHQVTVIAAVPHYPSGQVQDHFRKKLISRGDENGVHVIRVAVPSVNRSRLALRILQFLCYQILSTVAGLTQDCDVLLATNPGLTTALPLLVLGRLRGKPFVFSVHDVYPDVGVSLGVFRSRAIISFVAWLEHFCLNHAEYVRILSDSFAPAMRAMGVPEAKIVLIYDWVDTDLIKPMPCDNAFSAEHDLQDKFVVLYAGNIGLSQGLEHVLGAAERLSIHKDIRFLFVGDGAGRARLMEQAEQLRLANVMFLPFQPRARLPEVLGTADVSLVVLQKGFGSHSLPSKSFSILASGRPLISCVDADSDMSRLVERSQGGLCVAPEDPMRLAEGILCLKEDPSLRTRFGNNGRAYAMRYHSPGSAAEQFEHLLATARSRVSNADDPARP